FQLRKALGDPSYIVTVPGRGYRFASRVRPVAVTESKDSVVEGQPHAQAATEDEKSVTRTPASASKLRRTMLAASVAAILIISVAVVILQLQPSPKVVRVRQITHSGRVAPYGRVLSDGARLYFTERRGGAQTLSQVPVAGGEPASISTTVPSLTVYDIDPDR